MSDPCPQMLEQLETAGAVNRHAKNPLVEWGSWSEERERVRVRLLIVDTWWTKKDPFAAVFEGEVVPSTSTLTSTLTSTIDNCGRRHCPGVSD